MLDLFAVNELELHVFVGDERKRLIIHLADDPSKPRGLVDGFAESIIREGPVKHQVGVLPVQSRQKWPVRVEPKDAFIHSPISLT